MGPPETRIPTPFQSMRTWTGESENILPNGFLFLPIETPKTLLHSNLTVPWHLWKMKFFPLRFLETFLHFDNSIDKTPNSGPEGLVFDFLQLTV